MKTDLWKRTGESTLGYHSFALLISLFLVWTLGVTVFGAQIGYSMGANFWISLFAFIAMIAATGMFMASKSPIVSFIGVTITGFLLGIFVGPVLAYYNVSTIIYALQTTVAITVVMSIFGILFPRFVQKIGGLLLVGLLVITVSYWGQFFFSLFGVNSTILFAVTDMLAVFVFSGLIWFEWSRALSLPRTLDNAIDASGGIAIDVVNLFMVLLRIFGRR